ncbi:uncharacterized protein CMC5_005360 [Chondromyces crocatus]|uniref:Uncharacterized protein n=2 Tax=Chondromyces crocatus TaxID=52 RepID=A0A0K1E767_CHOCO|nr:uncharacterized protein CMC5_005360 [Chondromyces crocatus]
MKPVESGIVANTWSDADRLAQVSVVRASEAPFRFEPAVSPHLAARELGVSIELDQVLSWVGTQGASLEVIETAGALLSPLGRQLTNLDMIKALEGDGLILVGLDRLGILHEVAACLLALRTLAPELPLPVVVLNEPSQRDASTGINVGELQTLGLIQDGVMMPRGAVDDRETRKATEKLIALLEASRRHHDAASA